MANTNTPGNIITNTLLGIQCVFLVMGVSKLYPLTAFQMWTPSILLITVLCISITVVVITRAFEKKNKAKAESAIETINALKTLDQLIETAKARQQDKH